MFKRKYDLNDFDVRKELHRWVIGQVFDYLSGMNQLSPGKFPKEMFDDMVSHCEKTAWNYIRNGVGPGGTCSDLACELAIQAGRLFGKWEEEQPNPPEQTSVFSQRTIALGPKSDYHNPTYWDSSSDSYMRRTIG